MQDSGAVGGEDAGGNLDLVVEPRVGKDFEAGAYCPAAGVVGAIYKAGHASLDHGASAHAAGLDGDVQGGVGEAVVAEEVSGFANDHHFRVGRGVGVADRAIAGAGEDLAVVDKDGADGDFTGGCGGASFFDGQLHELDVGVHV